MGKFYDALEKFEKEKSYINKGFSNDVIEEEEPVKFESVYKHKLPEEENVLLLQQVDSPKPLKSKVRKFKEKKLEDIHAVVTEQFRILKTEILHSNRGNPPRKILIASALPEEGKTTVAANLGVSIAQGLDEHVLLVDCDFRKPGLHKLFNLSPKIGLVDYLMGDVSISQILLKTDVPKLSLLPAGKRVHAGVSLIGSEKMKALIEELHSRYDDRFIIFDSTPFQLTPEPRVLLSYMEGVVFIVRANKSNKDLVQKSLKLVDKNKLIGVVLNGVEPSPLKGYPYYKYY